MPADPAPTDPPDDDAGDDAGGDGRIRLVVVKVGLPPQLLARLDARTRRYGLTRAEQVRRAVADQVRDGR